MWKKIALGVAVVILALFVYAYYNRGETNARVANEIRTNPDGELAQKTMLVSLADGREFPVNYLVEDNLVFMGIDGRWWREFEGDGAPVDVFFRGTKHTGHARAELDDQAYIDDVFSRLRPTVPEWLPDWLNGKLVVITLDD